MKHAAAPALVFLLLLAAAFVAPAAATVAQPVPLREGFNFISLAVTPDPAKSASDLMAGASQIEQLFRFDAAGQLFRYRLRLPNGSFFGEDFPLAPGVGYVIKASGTASLQVPGTPFTEGGAATLAPGFNFLGTPPLDAAPTARALLEGHSALRSLFRWNPQTNSFGFVLRLPNDALFGEDFPLSDGEAYFLNAAAEGPVAFGRVRSTEPWPWYGTAAPTVSGSVTLDPATVVLTPAQGAPDPIESISGDTMVLSAEAVAEKPIEVGQVLVGTSTVEGQEGYLRKVTAVQAAPGGPVTVTTAPASMEEAFPDCTISFQQPISAAMVKSGINAMPGVSLAPSRGPVELSPIELNLNTDTFEVGFAGIKCYGKAIIKPTLIFDIDIKGGTLQSLDFRMKCDTTLDAKFSVETKSNLFNADDENIPLITTRLYTVAIWVATPTTPPIPIPIVFDLDINFYLVVNAEGQASVYAGYQRSTIEEYGFRYARGASPEYTKIYTCSRDESRPVPPTLSGEAKLRAGLKPEFAVTFYKMAGPKLSAYLGTFLTGGIVTRMGIPGTFLWWLNAGEFAVQVGGELSAFSKKLLDLELKIFGREWPWAQSPRLAAAYYDPANLPPLTSVIDLRAIRVVGNYADVVGMESHATIDPALVVWSVRSGIAEVTSDGRSLLTLTPSHPFVLRGKHTQLAKDGEELVGEFEMAWPSIASLVPAQFQEGVPIEVRGAQFGAERGTSELLLDGNPIASSAWSDTAITFLPPASALRGGAISVKVHGMQSNSVAFDGVPVTIVPTNPTVTIVAGQAFTTDPPTEVTWSVEPEGHGTISSSGFFQPSRGGEVTIRATFVTNPAVSWTTTARIRGITLSGGTGEATRTHLYTATVVNPPTGATYFWEFGTGGATATTSVPEAAYAFPTAGSYTVKVTMRDSSGTAIATAEATATIERYREILVKIEFWRNYPTQYNKMSEYEYYLGGENGITEIKHGYDRSYWSWPSGVTTGDDLLSSVSEYSHGVIQDCIWYSQDGKTITMSDDFSDGRHTKRTYYGSTGQVSKTIEYDGQGGVVETSFGDVIEVTTRRTVAKDAFTIGTYGTKYDRINVKVSRNGMLVFNGDYIEGYFGTNSHYIYGTPVGRIESFYDDGTPSSVGEFSDVAEQYGRPVGTSQTWRPNGQLNVTTVYQQGVPSVVTEYFESQDTWPYRIKEYKLVGISNKLWKQTEYYPHLDQLKSVYEFDLTDPNIILHGTTYNTDGVVTGNW